MIINKFVEIKITRRNIEHYSQFRENIKIRDIIEIDPNNLQSNCAIRLDVRCDICSIERNIKYQAYNKNINSCPEHKIYTCDKCSHLKIKSFNQKKWGVDYFSQTDEYNEKFKKTMVDRYGVEYALQSDELKEKVKKTNLERFGYENPFMDGDRIKNIFYDKYGVYHPSQVDEFSDKMKKTNLERFGYENPLSSPEIRDKMNNTNLERYGGHPMSNVINMDKLRKTNLERYGYEILCQTPHFKEKTKITLLEKYGVDNVMKSEEFRKNNFIISNDDKYIRYLGSSISLFYCDKGHEFEMNIDNYHGRTKYSLPLCTICYPIGNSRSIKEDELYSLVASIYDGEIIQSYRDVFEIDVYLPALNIGFEFNGLYWHSEKYKEKTYHLDKSKYFSERGIRIIHIWEDDWDNRRSIIDSQVRNWLGLTSERVYARKCKVLELKNVTEFLNENHIQGVDQSCLKLGLYLGDELVSVMTFNRFEGRKRMEEGGWNLSRFCNKIGFNVIGGASKLLNHFKAVYNPSRIVSYADRDWSQGDLYYTLGFEKISESSPDYKYLVDNRRVHKSNYRKSKLGYSMTETEYVKSMDIERVWDCGKIKFELKIN